MIYLAAVLRASKGRMRGRCVQEPPQQWVKEKILQKKWVDDHNSIWIFLFQAVESVFESLFRGSSREQSYFYTLTEETVLLCWGWLSSSDGAMELEWEVVALIVKMPLLDTTTSRNTTISRSLLIDRSQEDRKMASAHFSLLNPV